MRYLLPMLLLAAVAGPAVAADAVAVSERDCRWLVRHQPAPDVAYRPGVDARGRPVKRAELSPSGQVATPDRVFIDLKVPLRLLRPGAAPRRLEEAEADLGVVAVDVATGRVTYNGQLLGDPELERLAAACREALRR